MKKTIITISTLLAMSLASPVDIHNNHESGRQFSSSNLGGYASSFYHSVLGHSDPKTVECKIYYKYAKKIYYESKEVKHCHDEPSVECEDLMKMCHEEPEEVCGVKIEKGILLCWQNFLSEIAIFLIRTNYLSLENN